MEDLRTLMPHSKSDSKMHRKKEGSLFVANEIAEMKNCNKCVLFESRRKRDLYLWMANVARGPSAKFQVHRQLTKFSSISLIYLLTILRTFNDQFYVYAIILGTKRSYDGRA